VKSKSKSIVNKLRQSNNMSVNNNYNNKLNNNFIDKNIDNCVSISLNEDSSTEIPLERRSSSKLRQRILTPKEYESKDVKDTMNKPISNRRSNSNRRINVLTPTVEEDIMNFMDKQNTNFDE